MTQESTHSLRQVSPTWDGDAYRETLSHFCSGVTVISALTEDGPVGMTCQSFFSVSLEPPLVAFCVGTTSKTFPSIREVGECTINVLSESQGELSSNFARSETDKWSNVKWSSSELRAHPVLDDALAWFECDIRQVISAGDHYLVLAEVLDFHRHSGARPLLYFRSAYARLHVE